MSPVVTGAASGDPRRPASVRGAAVRAPGSRRLGGLSGQSDLLDLYARAHALLIPLFDDRQSRARFPTKIGEYLAAARPVVTNSVGEIPLHFTDGVDAVVCRPGDPRAFGQATAKLLADPPLAALIGRRGRRVAETRFHYGLHGDPLTKAFAEICRLPMSDE